MFLNRQRDILTTKVPSVSRKHTESLIVSYIRSILGSGTSELLAFRILDETSKSFPKLNATGRSLLIKFNSPGEEQARTAYLREYITAVTSYLVSDVSGRSPNT